MAFNLGYVRLCAADIQHIYTTRNLRKPPKRRDTPYKPEFLAEQAHSMRQKELNRRFMEYVPKHDIEIPKAPSFRTLSRDYVDTVVDRLTKPARERFNFRYPENDVYNDWRRVERERKEKLREILDQIDGKPLLDGKNQIEGKPATPENKKRRKARRKKASEKHDEEGHKKDGIKEDVDLTMENTDNVKTLPPIANPDDVQ